MCPAHIFELPDQARGIESFSSSSSDVKFRGLSQEYSTLSSFAY